MSISRTTRVAPFLCYSIQRGQGGGGNLPPLKGSRQPIWLIKMPAQLLEEAVEPKSNPAPIQPIAIDALRWQHRALRTPHSEMHIIVASWHPVRLQISPRSVTPSDGALSNYTKLIAQRCRDSHCLLIFPIANFSINCLHHRGAPVLKLIPLLYPEIKVLS